MTIAVSSVTADAATACTGEPATDVARDVLRMAPSPVSIADISRRHSLPGADHQHDAGRQQKRRHGRIPMQLDQIPHPRSLRRTARTWRGERSDGIARSCYPTTMTGPSPAIAATSGNLRHADRRTPRNVRRSSNGTDRVRTPRRRRSGSSARHRPTALPASVLAYPSRTLPPCTSPRQTPVTRPYATLPVERRLPPNAAPRTSCILAEHRPKNIQTFRINVETVE